MLLPRLLELSLLVSLTAAWAAPDVLNHEVIAVEDIGRRAADSSSATASTAAKTESVSASSASSASSAASAAATTGASNSAAASTGSAAKSDSASQTGSAKSASVTGKTSGSGTATTKKTSKSTSYDARLPDGGISMITPNAESTSEYYKIGNWVTFAWNYTSLSSTPTALDILASCSANQATYTLALNQSAESTKLLWDTNAYQSTATVPLLTETYTLIIYDADSSISATAAAGYLAVQSTFTFGMYTPQPYTPLADYQCATCSGALSSIERQTLAFLGGMATITVISFTWFAAGVFGVM